MLQRYIYKTLHEELSDLNMRVELYMYSTYTFCPQVTSGQISKRLAEAEQTELQISTAREKYRPVAARGSVMYFVVALLAEVDPMYQYSLKYFNQLFNTCIEQSEASTDLQKRLNTLLKNTTSTVYNNVAR